MRNNVYIIKLFRTNCGFLYCFDLWISEFLFLGIMLPKYVDRNVILSNFNSEMFPFNLYNNPIE